MSKLPTITQESDKDDVCGRCDQTILERCCLCKQFVKDPPPKEDTCVSCGQELSEDESSDEEGEGEKPKEDYVKLKHHVRQPICRICNRKRTTCPGCDEVFDHESDESEDSTEEESEDEPSEDESVASVAKPKGRTNF